MLRTAATNAGFKTVSDFVRSATIGDTSSMMVQIGQDVREILEILKQDKENKTKG
jgi:hypothetical protein